MTAPPPIDYLSPLPPVRSGIADYSVDLLPHLRKRADVRVLVPAGQPVDPEVARRFAAVREEDASPEDRLPLYQMGNNTHHLPVERMARERPGVLTLHDLVLHHLVSEMHLGERDFAGYRDRLVADHGWIGAETARCRQWGATVGAMLFELPAHRTLLRRQRGVLVHNRWAAERIAVETPEVRVRVVPMGVPLPPAADPEAGRAFRRRHGVPEDVPVLGSFGFQTPIKRTARAVEALARPELARPEVGAHLLVVGESPADRPGEPGALERLAAELGVADRVHVTGFVPYAEFEASIAACDLCLNLRYPTAGETSASLMRVLAAGRPAVVSDFAQFTDLPDEVVVKVPLGSSDGGAGDAAADEAEVLAARVAALLAEPERLAEMGRAARRHVEANHDPAAAAEAVLAACAEWAGAEPPAPGPETAGGGDAAHPPPPTSLTWDRLPARIEVAGLPSTWRPGERRRLAVTLTNTGDARWLAAHEGPGGVALEVTLLRDHDDRPGGGAHSPRAPWLPLPRDLSPGATHTFTVELRRPPGPARLRLALRRTGGVEPGGLATGFGAAWERGL